MGYNGKFIELCEWCVYIEEPKKGYEGTSSLNWKGQAVIRLGICEKFLFCLRSSLVPSTRENPCSFWKFIMG